MTERPITVAQRFALKVIATESRKNLALARQPPGQPTLHEISWALKKHGPRIATVRVLFDAGLVEFAGNPDTFGWRNLQLTPAGTAARELANAQGNV